WSPNAAEWIVTQYATAKAGLILVNINPAYRLSEVEYALNKVGCRALVTATRFKTSDYIGMVNTLAPELAKARPGHLDAATLPTLRAVIQIGGAAPGTIPFESVYGFDGPAQGCHADASQHPEQRLLPRPVHALYRAGQGMHSGADVSLFRYGDRQPGLPDQ